MKSLLLELNNISLNFADLEKPALNHIHYQIQTGDFIMVLGSNGSGKSSLLKLLNRQHQASAGEILFAGQPLKTYSEKNFRRQIKTLTQNYHESLFTSLTILENYLLVKQNYVPALFAVREKYEREFLAKYLKKFNINLATKLNQIVENLSGGEKQALALALTVLYPPRVLLLDEHTSALDPKAAKHLMMLTQQIAQQYNITCVLTTHDLAIAEQYGNRILALRQGEIHQRIESREKEQLNQGGLLAACY